MTSDVRPAPRRNLLSSTFHTVCNIVDRLAGANRFKGLRPAKVLHCLVRSSILTVTRLLRWWAQVSLIVASDEDSHKNARNRRRNDLI